MSTAWRASPASTRARRRGASTASPAGTRRALLRHHVRGFGGIGGKRPAGAAATPSTRVYELRPALNRSPPAVDVTLEGSDLMATPAAYDPQTLALGAEALLREHPDALVAGLAGNGLIVPVPQTVSLFGQTLIEGRAVFDNVVAADRNTVTRMWVNMRLEGATSGKVRMLAQPSVWMTLHFIDLREIHGIVLGILLPSEEPGEEQAPDAEPQAPAAPRFSTLTEDEGACVTDCDEAFTQMFGYELDEMYGKSVLDQIHPDDQGRAVEGWLTVLSTGRDQQTRLRRKRKDGSWMWVDTTLHNCLNEPGRNCVVVELIDISAEMQAQEALADREELLRRLTNAMPVGLLQVDTEQAVVYNNARLLEILHGTVSPSDNGAGSPTPTLRSASEDAGAPAPADGASAPLELVLGTLTEEARAEFDAALAEVLDEGVDRDVELDVILPHGEARRALMSVRALFRQSGEISGAITCVLDVTDSARARRELEHRATYDTLTGCHNRSSILKALQAELEREASSGLGVVYVDLDEFKPVNDKLGHAAGDELLVLVAERLAQASRDSDLVGRLGGDEFLVVLQDIPGAEIAMTVAERICGMLCGSFELASGTVQLRGSVGVACSHDYAGIAAEELVKKADAAMYESKQQRQGLPVRSGAPAGD
jgi:diguanylate cyclase (GGDEF)-like protein/PAS domain S-box-containing protein